MSRSLWQLLIETRNIKDNIHLTCDECFMLLEYDADLLVAGSRFDELQPAIRNHLALCSECQVELADRLEKLEIVR